MGFLALLLGNGAGFVGPGIGCASGRRPRRAGSGFAARRRRARLLWLVAVLTGVMLVNL